MDKTSRVQISDKNRIDSSYNYNYNNNYNDSSTQNRGIKEPLNTTIDPEEAQRLKQVYSDVLGRMTRPVAYMILGYLRTGLTVDNVIDAINLTAFAPRPSAAYLNGILHNWRLYGVTLTWEDHNDQ